MSSKFSELSVKLLNIWQVGDNLRIYKDKPKNNNDGIFQTLRDGEMVCSGSQVLSLLEKQGDDDAMTTARDMVKTGILSAESGGIFVDGADNVYKFNVDYKMKRSVKDVLPANQTSQQTPRLQPERSLDITLPIGFSGRRRESAPSTLLKSVVSPFRHASFVGHEISRKKSTHEPVSPYTTIDISDEDDQLDSLPVKQTVQAPRKFIRVHRDCVGYGFIIGGQNPVSVTTVDPLGPAVSAGIKENQIIYSVNDRVVFHCDHVTVAEHIYSQQQEYIDLIIIETS